MAGKRSPQMDVNSINRGRLRHPLFGNRNIWRDTNVTPGFIDKAADLTRDVIRKNVIKAIDRATAQLRAKH